MLNFKIVIYLFLKLYVVLIEIRKESLSFSVTCVFFYFFQISRWWRSTDFVQGGMTPRFFLFPFRIWKRRKKKKFTPELEKKPQDRLTEFPHATFFRSFSPILYFVPFICVIAIFQQQLDLYWLQWKKKKQNKKTEEETLFFFSDFLVKFPISLARMSFKKLTTLIKRSPNRYECNG